MVQNAIRNEKKEKEAKKKLLYKFNLRELGGAFGDWGTLIPFIIGYISIVGLNPSGIFLTLGITNIVLGIRFNLPLPVQPQKTIGTVAIAQSWQPKTVISTGFATGIIWSFLGFSTKLDEIGKKIPETSVRAIQFGLALILGVKATKMVMDSWILTLISILIIFLLLKSKKISSALLLTIFGILYLIFTDQLVSESFIFSWPSLEFLVPSFSQLWKGMLRAGFAQLILTLTNVMVATVALANNLFPQKKTQLNASRLAKNMGVMNIINPFMGGMPLCHGSGGLAAQYSFGARTGGSMILEGVLELIFGLFFSQTLLNIFKSFPRAILGTMLFYTALLLGRVAFSKGKKSKIKEEKRKKPKNAETMQKKQIKEKEIKENESIKAPKKESAGKGKGKGKGIKNELKEMSPFFFGIILISGIVCVFTNISIGFLTSLVLHYGWKRWIEKKEE